MKDFNIGDIVRFRHNFRPVKTQSFIKQQVLLSFEFFMKFIYKEDILHNDLPQYKIEKVFQLFHEGMVERRIDKIIFRNGNDKDTEVLSFLYDDMGYPAKVEGAMLNITIFRHFFSANNKIVYYIYDHHTKEKLHLLEVVKKDRIYDIIVYFGIGTDNTRHYQIKEETLNDIGYIKSLKTIEDNKVANDIIYKIEENKYGDIFIYTKDRNTRYNSNELVEYSYDGLGYFIHADMTFTFTHFDSYGYPYKAMRIDENRSDEYDIFMTSERYYTDKYPMGEKLIKSFRSVIDPTIEYIVLRNIDNGKYFSKQVTYSINGKIETYYPTFQFNSWREVISETHTEDFKYLYEFKMTDEDITEERIKELGGLNGDYNKSYHKIDRYGHTIKKVRLLGDRMSVYEEDIEKDMVQI
jgi:hypothetical protein